MLVINMDIKLSRVPKITYLNEHITQSLKDYIINDIINIIMKYFFKCSKCNHYFDKVRICKCKRIFCKYCYFKYARGDMCNNCQNIVKFQNKRNLYNCFVKKCENEAINGDENMPYYCLYHSKTKLLVNYYFACSIEKCVNIANYMESNYCITYCDEHKENDSILILSEGYLYKNNNKKRCNDCLNNVTICYSCSCGLKRCIKCTEKSAFCCLLDGIYVLKCNQCVHTINCKFNTYLKPAFNQFCGVYTCSNAGIYFNTDDNNYFCEKHKNAKSIKCDKVCEYEYCRAMRTTEMFCDIHDKKMIT